MPKKKKKDAHVWEKHPDNWYVEEQWCATRLFETVKFTGAIHDPCCGMGRIPVEAYKAGYRFTCSDLAKRHDGYIPDLMFKQIRYQDDTRIFDNIVTNPPFDDVNKPPLPFVQWALTHARHKVALLVPFKWFGGNRRSRILEDMPLSQVWIMTPRPSMPPGDALLEMWKRGEKPGGGKEDFAWAIFDCRGLERRRPTVGWIHRDKDKKRTVATGT